MEHLLSRDEAAAILGCKPQTLAVWLSVGRYNLPCVRVGRLAKYRPSDLEKWLASRTQFANADASAPTPVRYAPAVETRRKKSSPAAVLLARQDEREKDSHGLYPTPNDFAS